jgi:hypothetical protein
MKLIYLLPLLLVGCSTLPQPSVVTRTEYVIKAAPQEMYTLDNPVTDGDFTTQKGIADWIVKSEARMFQCEDKLNALQIYFSSTSAKDSGAQ